MRIDLLVSCASHGVALGGNGLGWGACDSDAALRPRRVESH